MQKLLLRVCHALHLDVLRSRLLITRQKCYRPARQPRGRPFFWILTCLAINSMAQPGGQICGLQNRYRTYLRCSPLICAADIMSILTRLLVSTAYQRLSLRESLGILLHKRFNSTENIHGPIEAMESKVLKE